MSEPEPPFEDQAVENEPVRERPTRRRWGGRAAKVVRPILVDRVTRDHQQSDAEFKRRRIVVAITLVVGATLLGLSFSTEQGEQAFYPLTIGLAATWVIGSLVSGPLHLGHIKFGGALRRPIISPILVGLLLAGIFTGGGLVFRMVPFLMSLVVATNTPSRWGWGTAATAARPGARRQPL